MTTFAKKGLSVTLEFETDDIGNALAFAPLKKFPLLKHSELAEYSRGEFCRFSAVNAPETPGVFAILIDGAAIHVGRTIKSLRGELNNFGRLSASAFKLRGQATHCRCNSKLLAALRNRSKIEVLVWPAQKENVDGLKHQIKSELQGARR